MRRHIRHFTHRHEPRSHYHHHLKSGLGAMIAMLCVGALTVATGLPLLIAPFGATAVLLFAQPNSALAQPANVIGGYLFASLAVALMTVLLPDQWWAAAITVGVAIGGMSLMRLTHPPAGAVPLVAFGSHQDVVTLLMVVSIGGTLLVAIAVVHHFIPPRIRYPLPAPVPVPTDKG